MPVSVGLPGFKDLMHGVEGDIARAATEAMRETSEETARELRAQVVSSGLGQRLANTWRWRVYPDQGKSRSSLAPAGFVWTRAPDIIDSFVRGATIVSVAGSRYLAIPTENVPRAGGRRGSTRRMTPAQVEHAFNDDLFYRRGRNGRVLAFINVVRARNGRGFRQATKGRAKQGRDAKPILMFVLVPITRLPKLLDLDGPAQRWTRRFEATFTAKLER